MRAGFTGTQVGMTRKQMDVLTHMIVHCETFAHGDCIGADAEAHIIAKSLQKRIILHPPLSPIKRAWSVLDAADTVHEPRGYIRRNHDIVDSVDVMFATPGQKEEQLRSGTWATIRYARKKGVLLYIIFPDGSLGQ